MTQPSPTSQQVRQQFVDFFVRKHGHTFVPSSPVVPHDDPTLMFANAGMNQFKPYFLGIEQPESRRAVNSQKCIRAGGKHNDLEDVGHDTYHHTFFEMLGNWSFGDYFKKEAIDWAWELLTGVWGIDPTRLHATYFEGDAGEDLAPDTEARDLWRQYLPDDRIHPGNKKDNFWEMGDTGPCGPCSEIHIDRTDDLSGGKLVNADDARVMEIWNLVFIQFNRDASGVLSPLPAKHVDTGMGFERICAVLQGKGSNYDTDVFTPLFDAIREVTGARPYHAGPEERSDEGPGSLNDPTDIAYRITADHVRCLTFALTDGAVPSNEGRGYVLRRILRRAFRYGKQTLGMNEPFLHRLVPAVVATMGDAFPELTKDAKRVADLIREEEESFAETIERGIALFEEAATRAGDEFLAEARARKDHHIDEFAQRERMRLKVAPGYWNAAGFQWNSVPGTAKPIVSATDAFKLYDTYGFPLDLTQVMAEERGMTVDVEGFACLMEEARERSRAVGPGGADAKQSLVDLVQKESLPATRFIGYEQTETMPHPSALRLFAERDGGFVKAEKADTGARVAIVVDQTPFYAEAGGQVGDSGTIQVSGGGRIAVETTMRLGDVVFHIGKVVSSLAESASADVALAVERIRRARIMANHTTTHVMNHKLRAVLGDHVQQKGSLVDEARLRFDFSHNAALTPDEIEQIEAQVTHDIAADLPVYTQVAPQAEAVKISTLRAVFGEKYPPNVRVVSIGAPVKDLLADPTNADWMRYSVEFCGGTHLPRTGDAEGFVIVGEEAVAKGVRRITALTGPAAHQAAAEAEMLLHRLGAVRKDRGNEKRLRATAAELTGALADKPLPIRQRAQVQAGLAELQAALKDIEKQRSRASAANVVDAARAIAEDAANAGDVIVAEVEGADANALRTAMDVIRKKRPEAALLLASGSDGKVAIIAAVPEAKIKAGLKAGDWVREVAKVVGGGGGGRPDMAQAGGKDPDKLPAALDTARNYAAKF